MTSPVYVAIDTPDLAKAQHLAGQVRHHVGGLKLGLEFFCANGHHGVHEMSKFGLPIFLDLKLHDIPNTVAKAVQAAKGGEVTFRAEKAGIVHAGIGKASFSEDQLSANLRAFVNAISRAKPSGVKGSYIKKVSIASTMSPGFKIELASALSAD